MLRRCDAVTGELASDKSARRLSCESGERGREKAEGEGFERARGTRRGERTAPEDVRPAAAVRANRLCVRDAMCWQCVFCFWLTV